jgi:4-hydroxy-tetrahydrodipicolinate synthase
MRLPADQIRERLRGVAAGLLTPFDDTLEVDTDALTENAQSLYDEGVRTFLATANISEYHSLSADERVEHAKTSVDALPEDACVLAGVGGSTGDAQELVRSYERHGVDAMMVMPPDHTYLHERGLITYYRELASVTNRPLVPYVRGFDPSVEFLASLTRVEGVVGVKYALEDPVKLGAAVAEGADDVVWVDGLAEPYAVSYWAEGVEGFTAGVSNFRPDIGLALYDALEAGRWDRARRIRNACLPFQRLRNGTGENNTITGAVSVPVVKKGLELAGFHGGTVREPIVPLSPDEEREVEAVYDRLEDDIARLVH